MQHERRKAVLLLFFLALVYGAGYWVTAHYYYFPPRSTGVIFSASGLILGALLLTPPAAWPAIVACVMGTHMLVACLSLGRTPGVALLATSCDAGEALLAALALRRWADPRLDLARLRPLLTLFGVTLTAALVGATVRAAFQAATQHMDFATAWFTWSCGDLTGLWLVAPMVVGWGSLGGKALRQTAVRTHLEGALILLATLAVAHAAFGQQELHFPGLFHLMFVQFSLLIWAALRFHPRLVVTAVWLIALVLIPHAAHGRGLLPNVGGSPQQVVLGIQALLLLIGAANLSLAALIAERRRDQTALRESHAELERRVADRTATLSAAVAQLQTEIEDRRRAEAALEHEQRTLQRLLRSSDHERQLIAYDIHDGLAQHLTGAIMHLQSYFHLRASAHDGAAAAFETGQRLLSQSLAEARRLISGVRPPILDEAGVVAAIAHLAAAHRSDDVAVDLLSRVEFSRLEPILENSLYRIAQEGLANACRYSQSPRIQVTLTQQDGHVQVEIRDWGVGFQPAEVADGCFGLEGIRQRARLLGGTATIESAPTRGTRVAVAIPLMDRGA